ncbi:hypothetical protein [Trichloromonas sp.]|uniref:hypothetical protein n=1 Tax=Trichloromonas sp. TaxID=3069249 RepID=UPI003D81B29F
MAKGRSIGVEKNGNFFVATDGRIISHYDRNGGLLSTTSLDYTYGHTTCAVSVVHPGKVLVYGDNATLKSAAYVFKIQDVRVPNFTVSELPAWSAGDPATLLGTVAENDQIEIDREYGGPKGAVTYPSSGNWEGQLSGLTEGDNIVSITAKNSEGFINRIWTRVILDTLPPVAVIDSPIEGSIYATAPQLNYSVSDGEIQVFLNGRRLHKENGELVEGLVEGANALMVIATDRAGNTGSDEVRFFAHAEAVTEVPFELSWKTQAGSVSDDYVSDFVAAPQDESYLIGYSSGDLTGTGTAGGTDLVVSRFDSEGNQVAAWQFGSANDEKDGVATLDAEGNLYLGWVVQYPSVKGKSVNYRDLSLAKLDPNGAFLWKTDLGSKGDDFIEDIVVDASGHVIAVGSSYESIDRQAYGGNSDFFIVKYDNAGNKLWTVESGQTGSEDAYAVAVNGNGGIYIVGRVGGSLFGEPVIAGSCAFVAKYSADGIRLWSRLIKAEAAGYASDVKVDGDGNVRVLATVDGGFYLGTYDGDGNVMREVQFPVMPLRKMVLDSQGNAFVVGSFTGSFAGNIPLGGSDVAIMKVNGLGEKIWTRQVGSDNHDYVENVLLASDGSLLLGGYTYGALGNGSAGGGDFFVLRLEGPKGPEVSLEPVVSPTKTDYQLLSGAMEAGTTISIQVDTSAIPGSVVYPTPTSWQCEVTGLVEGENAITISATDAHGRSGSLATGILLDITAPDLAINPVVSPTIQANQMVSGAIETGATVTVLSGGPATIGPVLYPTATTWTCQVTGLVPGDNLIQAIAADSVGNVAMEQVTITYQPPPPLTLAVSPAVIAETEQADIRLTVTNLVPAGARVTVEQSLDLNQNGVVEAEEPLVRRFSVVDGVMASDPNVPGDGDGSSDGTISVVINGQFVNDRYHAAGEYLFTVQSAAGADIEGFSVVETVQPQVLSGVVRDLQALPVGGALVELLDAWGRSFGFAMTDAAGQYRFNIELPGDYLPVPMAAGYVYDHAAAARVTVTAGQQVVRDLVLDSGAHQVSGRVLDAASLAGLSGVLVRAENARYLATTMTAADGSYRFGLPDAVYSLSVQARPGDGVASLGALGASVPQLILNVSANRTDQDLLILPGTSLSCGTVATSVGAGVAGVPVQAVDTAGSEGLAEALSDVQGNYCVALAVDGAWRLGLNDRLAQGARLVGTLATPGSPDLTVFAVDAWVSGSVRNDSAQPVAGVLVAANHPAGAGAATKTNADGRYLLGLSTEPAGDWSLQADAEELGYEMVPPVTVAPRYGQTLVQDFTVIQPVEPLSLDVDAVQTPTEQSSQTLSGNRSINAAVLVSVDTAAEVGVVSYPTATTWTCPVTHLAEGVNLLTLSATNGAEVTLPQVVSIEYRPVQTANSIVITSAVYDARKKVLKVNATSGYGNAQLQVDGYGPMTFSKQFKGKYVWVFAESVASRPSEVTVSGPEGSLTTSVK